MRRRMVATVAVLATLALGAGILRLDFETSQSSLVEEGRQVSKDNARYQDVFGGEPMLVLYRGDIETLFSDPQNLAALQDVEDELRASGRFHAVVGPLTVLRYATAQLSVASSMILDAALRLAPEARTAYVAHVQRERERLAAAGSPDLANPAFVRFLLYEEDGSIRPILRDNFLARDRALMVVRLPGNAEIAEQGPAADEVKRIVSRYPLRGVTVEATGPPVLLQEIDGYLRGGMATLGLLALAVMVVLLMLVFRVRWRLLALAVVAVGLVWAFGILGYLGVPLTMVTISGLPILLGLGVDFAVQMHNRVEEELEREPSPAAALPRALHGMGVPLGVAMVAAVAGFGALQLSEVPMIRQFGILLSVGTVSLVAAAVAVTVAALGWRERRAPSDRSRFLVPHGVLERVVQRSMQLARPVALAVGLLALAGAAGGFSVEERLPVETDPEAWVDPRGDAVRELKQLRERTGFSSEVDVLVEAPDVTSTDVASWVQQWANEQVRKHPELLRGTSLAAVAGSVTGLAPTAGDMARLLTVTPPDVRTSYVSADKRLASITFPIANVSLSQRAALLDEMRADLVADAPAGVRVTPAGLAVIGVELVDALEANRRAMTLVAIGLVALWLLVVYRRPARVLLTLVPVLLSVGASLVAIDALGIELTPLTTVSSPLVIAMATEFSVLVMARYLEERECGCSPSEAVAAGCVRIGRAFVASGLTLLGGFAVLATSPMPLLSEFGVVVAVNVAIALFTALVVLPPLLVWADGRPHLLGGLVARRSTAAHR